jgi:hypothetical protein
VAFSDLINMVDQSTTPHVLDYAQWDDVRKREYARRIRNSWLYESDWTQMPDSPLDTSSKELWALYRQQLRDMMSVNNIDDIIVPTPPGGN